MKGTTDTDTTDHTEGKFIDLDMSELVLVSGDQGGDRPSESFSH